jgi:hypothetical protein
MFGQSDNSTGEEGPLLVSEDSMVNKEYCPLDDMVKYQELPSQSLGVPQKLICNGFLRGMRLYI